MRSTHILRSQIPARRGLCSTVCRGASYDETSLSPVAHIAAITVAMSLLIQVPAVAADPVFLQTPAQVTRTVAVLPVELPPLPPIQPLDYKEVKLENGLRVFLVEDHEVPLIRGSLIMRGGSYSSPPDKVGLASVAASVQRSGGSTAHPAAQLDDRLEDLAAAIEAGAGPQSTSVGFSCMAEDVTEVVGLFSEVVLSPSLPQDKLDRYVALVDNSLQHKDDGADQIARRVLGKLMYGEKSVYAREPTSEGVHSITVADMRDFLATWQRPDTAVLGVVGDFDSGAMTKLIAQRFGGWQALTPAPPAMPDRMASDPVGSEAHPGWVYVVDKPGMEQASVLVAEPGIQMNDPDMYALDVLGGVLNNFGGLLFDEVRSKDGLAYSVSAGWDAPLDHTGLLVAAGETSVPGDFLKALQGVLGKATEQPPSEGRIKNSKDRILNSFVFNFASKYSQLQRTLIYTLFNLPQDFLATYNKGIQFVSQADVFAAAKRHVHVPQQIAVVVGDKENVTQSLTKNGYNVHEIASS